MYFETLADAVENLEVPGTCDAIAELLPLIDRLGAKVATAVDDVNRSGEWELEGATTTTAWLRVAGRMAAGTAKSMVQTAAHAAQLPVTASAWESGELSSAQVRAMVANIGSRRIGLFAEHEEAVVPALVPLTVAETAIAMVEWRERADAILDADEPAEPESSCTGCSRTGARASSTTAGRRARRRRISSMRLPCATAAAGSRAVTGRRSGAMRITFRCGTSKTDRRAWPTWC